MEEYNEFSPEKDIEEEKISSIVSPHEVK